MMCLTKEQLLKQIKEECEKDKSGLSPLGFKKPFNKMNLKELQITLDVIKRTMKLNEKNNV